MSTALRTETKKSSFNNGECRTFSGVSLSVFCDLVKSLPTYCLFMFWRSRQKKQNIRAMKSKSKETIAL